MTFDSAERSIEDSHLAELYVLTLGSTTFRYTSYGEDIEYAAATYTAIPIRRSQYGSTAHDKQYEMIVDLPVTVDFVLAQLAGVPAQSSTCTIKRLQVDEGIAIDLWIGECGPVSIEDDRATFRVACSLDDPVTTMVPSAYCQRMCNHVLYDEMCTIVETDHDLATTISAISGMEITIASTGALAGRLVNGARVRVGTEERMIVIESGTTLTLQAPFPDDVTTPVACTLIAGCAHTITACRDDFDNVDHYGGLPFLDWKNPFANAFAWLHGAL